MLTVAEVESQVEAVKEAALANQPALAFSLEITIWHDVLQAISDGMWDTQELSKAALATLAIKFPRTVA